MTRRLTLALAATSLLLPAAAASAAPHKLHSGPVVVSAAAAKKASTTPVIKKITPKSAKVGDKLTITGSNFVSGKGKNRVFFYKVGGGSVWVADSKASKTKIVVTIPAGLTKLLPTTGKAARVQVRIQGKRFGAMSKRSISPLIAIKPTSGSGSGTGTGSTGTVSTCTPNPANPASDVDGDLLSDALEASIKTDPCNKDSDGDGATDAFEYYSAKDLNNAAVPYPAKRPYPNPLFADADTDYDGDGLTNGEEYSLWAKYGNYALPLSYSDGKQVSSYEPVPTDHPNGYDRDMNGNGVMSDDERDADGDGIANWDESHGRMLPAWWEGVYGADPYKEKVYPVAFAGVSMTDPDSDGDGILDGADDSDFDGLSNTFEMQRPYGWTDTYVSTGPNVAHNLNLTTGLADFDPTTNPVDPGYAYYARVNPFNPCKPVWSSVCNLHPEIGYYPKDEDWMGWGVPGSGESLPPVPATPGQTY
jgi:hypothetical protein